MAELATLERLLKERDHIDFLIELLQSGDEKQKELAISILKQDSKSLTEAIEAK